MLIQGDARKIPLAAESVQCVVTSPPYWGLRDYGTNGQIGLERTPEKYVENIVNVFREVWRVLKTDGTVWLNLGDCYHSGDRGGYRKDAHRWEKSELQKGNRGNATTIRPNRLLQAGLKDKDLVGIPWRVAFALQADGWYLRSDIIWAKPNPMPESVTDRPTKAHEYIFLLSKSAQYYYDSGAIREPDSGTDHPRNVLRKPEPSGGLLAPHLGIRKETGRNGMGRNKRSVWAVPTRPYPASHFATFPEKLVEPCILAGSGPGDIVFDPFVGSGTTVRVANRFRRLGVGLDLAYQDLARQRLTNIQVEMFG